MSTAPHTQRCAIVTGSDSGIGKATAVRLAEEGCAVGVTWHSDEEGAMSTVEEIRSSGGRAEVTQLDLSDPETGTKSIDEFIDRLGRIDVFVNNAGTGQSSSFTDMKVDDLRHVLRVDLESPILCGQVAARRMIAQGGGGRIINVTSVHEHVPLSGSTAYCAAKGGLGLATKVMALELADHGITVNSVAPGEIATPMTGQEDVIVHDQKRRGIPLGRPGDAREIADAIAYLASPSASYTTGASFVIDGGMLLMSAMANRM